MKKELMKFILILFLFVFLISEIIAVDEGTCGIVTSADCNNPETEGYPVMGLSSSTNAHGQFPYVNYPYVVCCNFGSGSTSCVTDPHSNKLIGISSSTNAHAESPSILPPNYLTSVCYEDFECEKWTDLCPVDHPFGFLSLSADTNAHIGSFDDYSTKICCSSVLAFQKPCELVSASWNTEGPVQEGNNVYFQITGSGDECIGVGISFDVWEDDPWPLEDDFLTTVNGGRLKEAEASIGWWAELGGEDESEYYFIAALDNNPNTRESSNKLTVTKKDPDFCWNIYACDDYGDNELNCISDNENNPNDCGAAEGSGEGIVECSDDDIECGCYWDEDAEGTSEDPYCKLGVSYIDGGEDCDPATDPSCCEPGEALCFEDGVYICRTECTFSECNNDDTCDSNEGCACADCIGEQDSCDYGAVCSDYFGACACNYGFTLCIDSNGYSYCNLGNSCPSGDAPTGLPENNNGTCDFGFDGCSSNDCQNGDQDTCVLGTYCISDKCSSIDGPGLSFGNCKITQSVDKDCDEEPRVGQKDISWEGVWEGEPSGAAYELCIAGGSRTIPCPAQIQLPFFDYIELIITSAVIAGIYILLILKRKLGKKIKRRKR